MGDGCFMAEKSLEELLVETEQRILNNDFYKRFIISYEDEEYSFYIKPISQRTFMKLYTQYGKKDIMKLNDELIYNCLVKEDGQNYKKELIEILLDNVPAGVTTDIVRHIYEVSGIQTDKASSEQIERFLEGTVEL